MMKTPIILAAVALMALSAGCKKLPNDGGKKGEDDTLSGTVTSASVASTRRNQTMKYTVWLPAGYDESKTYPFLYLLHGYGDDNNSWVGKGGADKVANAYLKDGGTPMVIVMPDALTSFYVNLEEAGAQMQQMMDRPGHYEDYFIQELMPAVEARFHCNGKRALAGLSMGGWGTLYYGLKYPDKFLYGYAMSPATGLSWLPVTLQDLITVQSDPAVFPYITLESGTQDMTVGIESVRDCDQLLTAYDVRHSFIERDGGHDWKFWPECLRKALKEIEKYFK
jgi:S-formylglutathione hydrolase FrmB